RRPNGTIPSGRAATGPVPSGASLNPGRLALRQGRSDPADRGDSMTHTDEGYQSNPSILAIGQLVLYRETIQELRGNRQGRSTSGGSINGCTYGCTFVNTCATCRHCTHKGC